MCVCVCVCVYGGGGRVAGLPACLGKQSHDPFDGNAEIQSAASEEL